MSLIDKLQSAANKQPTPKRCKIGMALEKLPEDERKAVIEAFETPVGTYGRISNSELYRIFRQENYNFSLSTVDRHRLHTCGCFFESGETN